MSLTAQSLLLSAGRFTASLARLAVNLLVARIFAERLEFTAEYQKVWLLFNTTYMIFILGIPATIYYFHPRLDPAERAPFLWQSYSLFFLLGLVYFLFLSLVGPAAAQFYGSPPLAGHMRVFAVYGFAMVAGAFLEPVMIILGRLRLLAGLMMVEAALFLLLAVGPIALGEGGAESGTIHLSFILITALALGRLLLAHGLLARLNPKSSWRGLWLGARSLRDQLRYALPITATTIVAFLATYLDKNVVAAWFEDGAVYAIYQAGAMEVPFVSVFVGSVSAVMLPHLSRLQHQGRREELCRLLAAGVEKVAWVVFPLCSLLMVVADPLYVSLWGPEYRLSALPFRLYLLIFPLRLMFYGQVLNTLGKARWVLYTALGDLLLNAGLSLMLVRWLGMPGPAIATVVATVAELLVFMWLIGRTLEVRLGLIFAPRRLLRIGILSAWAGLGAFAGRLLADGSVTRLLGGAILHLAVFAGLLWITGEWRRLRENFLDEGEESAGEQSAQSGAAGDPQDEEEVVERP